MSYTLTIDEPSVASYVTRRGPQFREEFNALLVAYVQTRMSYEQTPMQDRPPVRVSICSAVSARTRPCLMRMRCGCSTE